MKTMEKIVAIVAVALMLVSILPLSVFAADTYELASSIEVGDTVVLACKDKSMELSGISTTSTKYGIGVAYSGTPIGAYVLTVEAGSTSGTYSFKCPNGQYLYWTSGNSLATNASKSANSSWKVTFSGTSVTIVNAKDNTRKLQWNASSPRFACYSSSQTAVQLFKLKADEPEVPSACEHKNAEYDFDCVAGYCPDCKEELPAKADHSYAEEITLNPTCTVAGEKTLTCACGDEKTESVPALGHDFSESDICAVCGEEKPLDATITFDADKTQRTEYTTTVQKWENDGLTLINNKASSTTNVGDYSNPGRFYKSSTITISFPAMTSLVINAPSGEYGTPWAATLTNAGYTYTNEGAVYTVTFAEPVDSITLTCSAQIRAYSITAYGTKKCEHEFDNNCDNECNLCGEANPNYADHVYSHAFDATCDECGAERAVAGPLNGAMKSISEDVNGYAVKFDCAAEGFAILPGTFVQADYTNATYNGYKLVKLGVIASNGVSETNIEGLRMYDLEDGVAKFAFRVINIPADKLDTEITMTPYYVVEIDGVATTIEGEAVVGSYTAVAG